MHEKNSRIHLDLLQNKCTNCKGIKYNTNLDKLLEYKRNWLQHVNRMPCNKLPRVLKCYSPTGRRNHGRPLKRLQDTWDRSWPTSGPNLWQIYDDDLAKFLLDWEILQTAVVHKLETHSIKSIFFARNHAWNEKM